jgi:phospholipid N-methyltransferase
LNMLQWFQHIVSDQPAGTGTNGRIPLNVYFKFLSQYMRNVREVGSVSPDSSACIDGLLKSVHFDATNLIVEFGSGSGAVTREILCRKSPESLLICFEKNTVFYNDLRTSVPGRGVFVVPDDVFNASHVLSSRFGIPERSVDCIISTLPCSSIRFNELLNNVILPMLNDDGVFIQYMHVVSVLKGFRLRPILGQSFSRIESNIIFMNVPPVLVYTCRMNGSRYMTTHIT